jgi:putative component of toxin-antitoxin plasmid stabilization module
MDHMNTINATEDFQAWIETLSDLKARAAIVVRIRRAELATLASTRCWMMAFRK